jgi:creatinine amidohydrolase
MKLLVVKLLAAALAVATPGVAQDLPARWDELVASDWPAALQRSAHTCVLPIGILEKHGPQAPIGSDCDEIGRNGFDKIVIVNGHGGNPQLLRYFIQTQLGQRRPYVVYLFDPAPDPDVEEQVSRLRKSDPAGDMHAGERETSTLLYLRPDLVKLDRATEESGENQRRLSTPNLYTAIWWYAGFPNHYAGEGAKATRELGQVLTEARVAALVRALRAVKADARSLELQNEYFDRVDRLGRSLQ